MSTISASTTSTTAYKVTADTTGTLVLQTGATPTTAMTLDASGNLLVNNTNGTYRLTVVQDGGSPSNSSITGSGFVLGRTNSYSENLALRTQLGTGISGGGFVAQVIGNGVNALELYNTAATPIVFGTSATERARITSGGYFKASSTGTYNSSTGSYHELRGSAADTALYVQNTNASSPYGMEIDYTAIDPNGTGNAFLGCYGTTTLRAQFRSNGGLANYSANNVNLSDRREKTNFAPAGDYLSKICAIPVQTFNYIDQNMEEDGGLTLGVVAQDVQAVAPELVMESNWGTAEEPKMRLSIYQTDLQYALMKCIQELKAELDVAKAEIAALKGTQ